MVDEKFQREKLRYLASRLLATFAKKKDLECDAVRLFARELLAMQVFNLTATSCSTASYINWYIVETFKDVQDQSGLLSGDSRAKEAEEAMTRAVAEAAEMTRLLKLEKGEGILQNEGVQASPFPDFSDPAPKTTNDLLPSLFGRTKRRIRSHSGPLSKPLTAAPGTRQRPCGKI